MSKKVYIILLTALTLMSSAQSSEVGISVHPLESKSHFLNTEYTGKFSRGSSHGMQVRYVHSYTSRMNLDAGFRVYKQDISTLFASATYEVFPDFGSQPLIAGKVFIERERYIGDNVFNVGFAPIVSKGYSLWGYPAYPYVSIPMKLALFEKGDNYVFASSLALGISGNLPFQGFNNVIANIETNIDLKDSYSSLAFGVSMNFQ